MGKSFTLIENSQSWGKGDQRINGKHAGKGITTKRNLSLCTKMLLPYFGMEPLNVMSKITGARDFPIVNVQSTEAKLFLTQIPEVGPDQRFFWGRVASPLILLVVNLRRGIW
jgi:hypothetical protein